MEDRSLPKVIEQRRSEPKVRALGSVPWPRIGNLLIGIWLQAAGMLWLHDDAARLSAWLPGLLISIVAVLSMSAPPMRYLNSFLAGWLVLWTISSTAGDSFGYFNGLMCSALVFVLSAIPSPSAATDFRE